MYMKFIYWTEDWITSSVYVPQFLVLLMWSANWELVIMCADDKLDEYISVYDKLWELSCCSESQESELKVKSSFQWNVLHLTPVIMILQKNCVHWGSTMSIIIMRTDQSQWLRSRPWLLNSLSSQLIYGYKSKWKL